MQSDCNWEDRKIDKIRFCDYLFTMYAGYVSLNQAISYSENQNILGRCKNESNINTNLLKETKKY